MKFFRKGICLFLTVIMALSLAGCGKKELSHEKMNVLVDEFDFEEYDDVEDFIIHLSRFTGFENGYISAEEDDAQELYDIAINRMHQYPSYNIDQATLFFVGEGEMVFGYLLTFEKDKKAEKFYDYYTEDDFEDGKTGEKDGYSYAIEIGEESSSKIALDGAYLQGNKVFILRGLVKDTDFIDDLFKELDLISPTEADQEDK